MGIITLSSFLCTVFVFLSCSHASRIIRRGRGSRGLIAALLAVDSLGTCGWILAWMVSCLTHSFCSGIQRVCLLLLALISNSKMDKGERTLRVKSWSKPSRNTPLSRSCRNYTARVPSRLQTPSLAKDTDLSLRNGGSSCSSRYPAAWRGLLRSSL